MSKLVAPEPCPLCQTQCDEEFSRDKKRPYLQCPHCKLVFVPRHFHLSAQQEKAEYDKHQNQADDMGYRRFLARTVTPLIKQLPKNAQGLDFGCGPGPTLSLMMQEADLACDNYDLYYFNHPELLQRQYDFITMTEVIEHLATPINQLQQLDQLLKPSATLAVMTKRVLSADKFKNWHYKNDPTHICFYSIETFEYISDQFNWKLDIIDQDVVFFEK
ncbi:methyltransferase [Saccharobesus litoralis]|uniref:Methyltransferase n=1 Tax=Saccharobesus litoralis TaxID=2172099 RepID=A0A2S0VML0_9ALTE|nr:class I SAM-dependent methyltransferase [Saccharobesus litoralis]AWB65419.1 methyltransferase [Saccharobesus litoralis]